MQNNELNIDYRITGIRDSPVEKGKVEVFMEPVEVLEKEENHHHHKPQMIMTNEMPNPQAFMQMFQNIPEQLGMKQERKEVPRTIIHVEDSIEFLTRGWKHGDIMAVTIKKKEQ